MGIYDGEIWITNCQHAVELTRSPAIAADPESRRLEHTEVEREQRYSCEGWLVAERTGQLNEIVGTEELDPEALMRAYLERVVAEGELDLIENLAHADMVDEANQAFGGPVGRAGLVAHAKGFRRYITDLDVTIERVVGNGDTVMAWWSFSGVHTGPWLGKLPTGQVIQATVFSFFDLTEGRISRYRLWLYAGFDDPVIFDSSRPDD